MKRVLHSLLLCLLALIAKSQTATVTLVTAPCTANGVITVNTTGLTPPLTFTYYFGSYAVPPVTHSGVTGTSDNLSSWMGGDVTIYVRDATTGFAYTNYSTGPVNLTFTSTIATCPTPSTLTATATGGTSPYTYAWYDASGVACGTTNVLSSTRTGDYYLIVSDNAGCYLDSRYGADTTFLYSAPPFTYTTTQTAASCTNGTATISGITGGTSPYSYIWSSGATTPTCSGLSLGSVNVGITDAAGCTDIAYFYINQTPYIPVTTTITPPTCLDTNGAIIAFGSGGVSPYRYLWSNGATTQSITGLGSGLVSVTATDANGCVGQNSAFLTPATTIVATYSVTPSSCTSPTGTATLSISGGTSPYTIQWYTTPPQTGITATNLAAGTYAFKITDAAGCVRTGSVSVPPVVVISPIIGITAASCTSATGGIVVTPSGGTTPYTYAWSTGSTASSVSGLVAGYYSVTVTDANGCRAVKNMCVPSISPIRLHFSTTPASCLFTSDASITASTTGSTGTCTYLWNTGATTATISGIPSGLYWVHVTDAAGCTALDSITVGYNPTTDFCYCTIKGTVYYDVNGNCTQDATEHGIHNIQLHCSTRGYTYTDTAGRYEFKVPSGSYTVAQTILGYYPLAACQTNSITVTAVAASGCVHTVNFADTIYPIHDIHISNWNYTMPVPGNVYTQKTIVTNLGTQNEPAVVAGYQADGQLFSPTFVPTGGFALSSGYWYSSTSGFPAIAPAASQTFFSSYNVPTNIPLGTSVLFKDTAAYAAPMSNWLTDYSPWDNTDYFTTVVVSSYDPNFKEVSPKGTGPAGIITYNDSVLEYMVHFQNMGTWYAQNVVVIDTLDADLDWTSLRPIYSSHDCKVSVSENGVATFTFKDIHLDPQIFNDLRSNGMFTYTIKTKPGLPLGTQFKNSAAIYFDYNKPIYTNTTVNTILNNVGVPHIAAQATGKEFQLYPNPAGNSFSIAFNSDAAGRGMLIVTDVAGKTRIMRPIDVTVGPQSFVTDAATLNEGIYFVTVSAGAFRQTQKLLIMK